MDANVSITGNSPRSELHAWRWILLGLILALLLGLSFGAGFLIAREAQPIPIIIEKCSG